VNSKYSSFRQEYFFDIKEIFRRIKFTGGGEFLLPGATVPVVEGYVVTLLPETSGTRVQKYPKVRALTLAGFVVGIERVAGIAPSDVTSSRLVRTTSAVSGAFCRKQINHVLALTFLLATHLHNKYECTIAYIRN